MIILINIVLCDDEPSFLKYMKISIEEHIRRGVFADFEYNINIFDNPIKAFHYCKENKIHIALIDIDMPVVNGFDIAEYFKSKKTDTKVIFVTSYDNLVYSAFKYKPLRFIKKKSFDNDISEALYSALEEVIVDGSYWSMGKKYNNERVLLSDIVYIESRGKEMLFYCTDKEYVIRDTMVNIEANFTKYQFVRIHSGYLVNMKFVKSATNTTIFLSNGLKLPLSRQNRSKFNNYFASFLMN